MRLGLLVAMGLAGVAGGETAFGANYVPRRTGNFDFPVYTNKPPGRQLAGAHAPATTPALSPGDTQARMAVPPGFEVRLFASEPEVAAPVAMTWDERGRLWVLEFYEYPKGAPKGTHPRDRIKILEDTDADGRADKATVFADGLNLATGLLVGHGGVFVGQAPDLLFLEDTDGDGKADRRTILKTGFGLQDRHELLNGFGWGPDGYLYMTHGVFTYSKVRDPNNPDDASVAMNAAVARYHPRTRKLEVVADGTSNPWGVDFDAHGHAFVSACVIPHLFHMAPGGIYERQSGQPIFPYAYGLLPSLVNYRHYRAAHAGIQIYQGDQYPAVWRGLVLLGNIHQNAVNADRLQPLGCTFQASKESTLLGPSKGDFQVGAGNFLVASDPWSRPVSIQTGPDGALWVLDWYDRYPCYQNAMADPEGVDREHGRVWRVVWVGDQPGRKVPSRPRVDMDLKKLHSAELVELLAHPNSWHRRTAQRLLSERQDRSVKDALVALFQRGPAIEAQLAALWTLHGAELLDDRILDQAARDSAPPIRLWAARLTAERGLWNPADFKRLTQLARDTDVTVRAGVATALRLEQSGSLTVNTTPPTVTGRVTGFTEAYESLLTRPSVAGDKLYDHLVWMMLEPVVSKQPDEGFHLLGRATLAGQKDVSTTALTLGRRFMRRLCDETNAERRQAGLNRAVAFLDLQATPDRPEAQIELAAAVLDGLLDGFKAKGSPPSVPIGPTFEKLYAIPALADRARRLGVLWGDQSASHALIQTIRDARAPESKRLQAIQAASEARSAPAREALVALVQSEPSEALVLAALRALSELGGSTGLTSLLDRWNKFTSATRRAAVEVLVTRPAWAQALLGAVEAGKVLRDDLSASALRALSTSPDASVKALTTKVLGRVRAADSDKLKLIVAKRKVVLSDEPDFQAGYKLAKDVCLVCHKLHGDGGEVGPDLTGVGRSTLDALLANVIDPNQVIGQGYESVEVETKDGRALSGRLIENTDTRVVLLSSGPKEEVIAKTEIAVEDGELLIRISDWSVMPEGLEQMPDADFRNLIWYILNPPQDNRPLTPEVYRELTGVDPPQR